MWLLNYSEITLILHWKLAEQETHTNKIIINHQRGNVVVVLWPKNADFPLKSRSAELPCDHNAPPLYERVPNQKNPKKTETCVVFFSIANSSPLCCANCGCLNLTKIICICTKNWWGEVPSLFRLLYSQSSNPNNHRVHAIFLSPSFFSPQGTFIPKLPSILTVLMLIPTTFSHFIRLYSIGKYNLLQSFDL